MRAPYPRFTFHLFALVCLMTQARVLALDTVLALSWNDSFKRWEQFEKNGTVWITADPLMPYLAFLDTVTGGAKPPVTTIWQFRSQYTKKSSRSIDSRAFPTSGFIGLGYGKPWYPSQQYFGSQFFGGDASVNFSDNVNTSVRTFPFKIRGVNPSPSVARRYISSRNAPYYASAIFQHESRSGTHTFNQFYPTGSSSGEPVFGAPDGWGIAQLDYSPQRTAATMEVWNWQVNLDSGLAILQDKRQIAADYFAYIKRTYPSKWEEPPASYRDTRTTTSFPYLDAATITLYNGASVTVRSSGGAYYLSCWKFTSSNAAGKRWTFVPNSNDYLYKIALEIQGGG